MSIYLSINPVLYREWLIALFPPVHRELVRDVLGDISGQLRSWIVGQLTAMLVLAAMTAIGLYLLNVPYWLTFGVFTGAVAVVPFFGTLLSTLLPAAFVLALPDGGTRALLVVALGVVIHLIEGNFVAPLIASRRVEIPPVLSIMSVLIIGKLLGPVGLLVAVPTVAALMVVVRRILVHRVYEGHGFRRAMRDQPMVLRVPPPDGDGVLLPAAARLVDVPAFTAPAPPRGRRRADRALVSSPLATPAAAPSSSGRPLRFLILADGSFGAMTSEDGQRVPRYTPERAVAVLDAASPGRTAQQVLGFGGAVPVVATLAEGSPSARRPSSSASPPAGGRLPDAWRALLATAARRGLDVWSGLHTYLADDPVVADAAREGWARVVDLRRPPCGSHRWRPAACGTSTRRWCSPSGRTATSAR
jgi:hypothetical protein